MELVLLKRIKNLDADFSQKTLQDQVIQPYGLLNGLVFVPNSSLTIIFLLVLLI